MKSTMPAWKATAMNGPSYPTIRLPTRRLPAAVAIAAVIVTVVYVRHSRQQHALNIGKAQSQWTAILNQEAAELRELRAQAVEPIDDYFNQQALPHIAGLLGDFSGPIDSAAFVWRQIADKIKIRDDDQRVKTKIQASLAAHMGFPSQLEKAIDESVARYRAILQQRDAQLRDQAYAQLRGAGIEMTRAELAQLLADARQAAEQAAFAEMARHSLIDFGNAMAGKEAAVIAVQTLIIRRVAVAVGQRLGILTIGAGAAGASSAGGPPGWALAAGELLAAAGVDLLAGGWLESRAEAKMIRQLREVQKEIGSQMGLHMAEYEANLRKQRQSLMAQKLNGN